MTLVVEPATWLGRFSPRLWALANGVRLAVETRLLRGGAIGHGPRGLPRVALTFDDGPDPRWTPGILDHLERAGARATFFFTGMNVAEHPELAREVASRHQVGTHLFSHHRGLTRDRRFFLDDMERAREVHERVLGRRPGALRFPFGDSGRIRAVELRRYGLVPYHWSFSTLDSRAETKIVDENHPYSRNTENGQKDSPGPQCWKIAYNRLVRNCARIVRGDYDQPGPGMLPVLTELIPTSNRKTKR